MTETVSLAPVAPASAVPPSTPVVVAAVHKSIVASLEADLAVAEADVAKAWHGHQVLFVVGLAILATVLVLHFVF